MARGASLLELVGELRVELGRAPEITIGPSDLPMLKRVIRRVQKVLWTNYEWPFMRQVFDPIPLLAGQRFYQTPVTLDVDRIESVALWMNDIPTELARGIGWEEYAAYKPEVRADPTLRWDVRTKDDFSTMIEVWPTPAGSQYTLQIIGIRNLRPLVHDADLADLDDELIVMFAAAQILARQKAPDATVVMKEAQDHLARVRAKASTGQGKIVRVGLGPDQSKFAARSRILVAGYPVPK